MKKFMLMCSFAFLPTLGACTHTGVMQLSNNVVEITAVAAPACGVLGAQDVASKDAAIATIQHGFDSYIIMDGQASDNVGAVGYIQQSYNSGPYSYNTSTPIIGGTYKQGIFVRMFHANDPGSDNAISAKDILGTNWQQIASSGFPSTCL